MNTATAQELSALTSAFYRDCAASFSATRTQPWPGWSRCLDAVSEHEALPSPYRFLDLGCGNLRFERFVRNRLPQTQLECLALDATDALLPSDYQLATCYGQVRFVQVDVVERLLHGQGLGELVPDATFHLVACFGFAHHVPGADTRLRLMQQLAACACEGGLVACSFWRFADDADLLRKARAAHEAALTDLAQRGIPIDPSELDTGDYLLGWQNTPGAWRYCHSFSDDEIDSLVAACTPRARQIQRFSADGRTGALNTYCILEIGSGLTA